MEGCEGAVEREASASVEAFVRATLDGHQLEAAVATIFYREVLNRRLPTANFELTWKLGRVSIVAISRRESHGARGTFMHLSLKW